MKSHGYKCKLESGNTLKIEIDNRGWTVNIDYKDDRDWHEAIHANAPIWEDYRKWQQLPETLQIDPEEWNKIRSDIRRQESEIRFSESKVEEQKESDNSQFEITISGRHMQDITADALPAINVHNIPPHIFVRAGSLVRVRSDEHGTICIEPLSESALRGILARAAKFIEINQKGSSNADPPLKVVKDILALTSWPGIPPITGIIESPVIRPDGSLLDQFGYDAATELYYASGEKLVLQVPDNPSKDDTLKAAQFILSEILIDFPFKDYASKANAFAALLTPIASPLINGNIPLGLIDKPQAGTGASLLTEIIAEIATGKPAHLQTAPSSDEEWRKAITSTLMNGPPIVVIDNVDNILKSRSLSQMLTARIWVDRILGQSKMIHLPQTAAWFATGNNIQLGGDVARRAYWIRLDAGAARPWLRKGFRHDPLIEWVRSNRSEILSSLLTMIRAWIAADKPQADALLIGSFNEWCQTIGGILAFSGVDGFLGNASQLYDNADQEIAQWDLFLGEWRKLHWDTPITAAALKADLTTIGKGAEIYRELQAEMPEDIIKATGKESRGTQALGVVLRARADQVFPSGRKLVSEFDKHTKAQKWTVIQTKKPETNIVEPAGTSDSPKTASSDDFAGSAGSKTIPNEILENNGSEKNTNNLKSYNRQDLLPALPANEVLDSDFDKHKVPANLGKQQFEDGPKNRVCIKCHRMFDYDLSIHYLNGYICYGCHAGYTASPTKPESQTTLNNLGEVSL